MSYKQELQRDLDIKVQKKLEFYPQFVKEYFDRIESSKTKNVNFGYIKHLFDWLIDNKIITDVSKEQLNKVTTANIINYLNGLNKGIGCNINSSSTVNTKKKVINAFWNFLELYEHVNYNVLRKIPKGKYKVEVSNTGIDIKIPTKEELDTFIGNIISDMNEDFGLRNLAIVRLFLGSGIRSEELIGLDLDDLFLDNHPQHIMIMGKGYYEVKSRVIINNEAKENLIKYLEVRNKLENIIDKNALFISNQKTRLSKSAIDNMFNRYSNNTITPHMLRHWYGTELYNKTNKDILAVQKQLRHKNIETAVKYYVKIDESKFIDTVINM